MYQSQGLTRREGCRTFLLVVAALCVASLFVWLRHGGSWASVTPEYPVHLVRKASPPAPSPPPPPPAPSPPPPPSSPSPSPSPPPPASPSSPPPPPLITSEVSLRANMGPSGDYSRKRYLFRNVWLRDAATLAAFLPPDEPLPAPLVSNAFSQNVSAPQPPTAFTIAMTPVYKVTTAVAYRHAAAAPGGQPRCARWEDRPAFLMFTPHHNNVWHVLTDALIASFQTLREEGLAPLARVGPDLAVREYTSGLAAQKCPKVFDRGVNVAYRPEGCRPRAGLVPRRCDPGAQDWCRPGLVAVNRTGGPILLLSRGSVQPDQKWRHLFLAVSDDIRDWEAEIGTCFRELYVGKSATLNFYMTVKNRDPAELARVRQLRRRALRTVQDLLTTAEAHHIARQRENDPVAAPWTGYSRPGLERLRRGVGPEGVDALEVLRRLRLKAIDRDVEGKAAKEMARRLEEARPAVAATVAARARGDGQKAPALPIDATEATVARALTHPRPVVTFLWRAELSRCALNEADLLEYLLRRYNVTVRVTTFEEPALEMMQLMNATDVVIGMHGAGWTNTLFLKPGAAGLQLHPYGWLVARRGRFNTVRGGSYKNIVRLLGGAYVGWVNPHAGHAFIREEDFRRAARKRGASLGYDYAVHPEKHWERPMDESPGDHWIYQNTLLDVGDVAPAVDAVMALRGIQPMDEPLLD